MNTKPELLAELESTHQRTMALIESLSVQQLAVPYQPGINPPVWELGHAAFFYEYFILRELDDSAPVMPGYDEIWDSFEIQHQQRWKEGVVPDKVTTVDYYRRMIAAVRDRIETHELTTNDHYLYKYAIFHQHMHVESLIWCRQTLGYEKPPASEAVHQQLVSSEAGGDASISGGVYQIGLPATGDHVATTGFGFDCEKPTFEMEIAPFEIAKTLVSNREFLEFVVAGMYANPAVWSYGGQQWLASNEQQHPIYWRPRQDGSWQQRFFDQWQELPLDAPVMHVSFWEADAYCRWVGRRLPNEFEWEITARGAEANIYPWGDQSPGPSQVDMNGNALGQQHVASFSNGATDSGCLQMLGTAWEWTSSQFLPFKGFCVDMYPYMSTLQFGDHKVARGGSCATSSCLIRNTYRQAYHPNRQDVFTGFRTCAV